MEYEDLQKEFEKNMKNTKAMLDHALKKMPVNDQININRFMQQMGEEMESGMKKASEGEFNLAEYSKNILKIHEQYNKNGLKGN